MSFFVGASSPGIFCTREKDARSFSTLHAMRERKGIFSEEVNSSSDEIGHSLPSKLSLCLAFLARFYLGKKRRRKETLLLRFLRCLSAVVKKIVADHRMEDLRGRDEITVFQGGGGGSCARKKTQFGISR